MFAKTSLLAFAFATAASAAVSPYGQCGGQGWTGDTTCTSGYSCSVVNQWYYQCLPGSGTPSSSAPPPTGTGCGSKLKYFGVNQAGAEFGDGIWPGALNKEYIWPAPSSIDYFVGKGFNVFRVPFSLERLVPPSNGLSGNFNTTYFQGLKDTVSYITGKGASVAIEPHNYMRYNHNIISDTTAFTNFWKKLATEFKSNSKVIFDIMNEPYEIPASTVFSLNQAAVNAIRSVGATSQLILVEGTSWTGAWTWISSGNADAFQAIKDPNNNVAIEMHQYLDSDGSGTSGTCVSSTIGVERLKAATEWLKSKGLKGFLGEMGAGSNDACIKAVKDSLCYLRQSGVWIGFTWWSAGPWWGDYFQSLEPPNGAAISRILPEALLPNL